MFNLNLSADLRGSENGFSRLNPARVPWVWQKPLLPRDTFLEYPTHIPPRRGGTGQIGVHPVALRVVGGGISELELPRSLVTRLRQSVSFFLVIY